MCKKRKGKRWQVDEPASQTSHSDCWAFNEILAESHFFQSELPQNWMNMMALLSHLRVSWEWREKNDWICLSNWIFNRLHYVTLGW